MAMKAITTASTCGAASAAKLSLKVAECSQRVYEARGWARGCVNRGKVRRGGKWYCAIHDPEKVMAKRKVREEERVARNREQDEIEAEAGRLAARLGAGEPHYCPGFGNKMGGYVRRIELTFAEVRQLIDRLRRK